MEQPDRCATMERSDKPKAFLIKCVVHEMRPEYSKGIPSQVCRGAWTLRCVRPSVCPSVNEQTTNRSEKRTKIERKSTPHRAKIEPKSTQSRSGEAPGRFGATRDDPGRFRDAPGTVKSAPGPPQERSWGAPGRPRALWKRPGARQERSGTLRESSRDARGARSCRRTPGKTLAHRFSMVFAMKTDRFSRSFG
jgi:hypothetical protein